GLRTRTVEVIDQLFREPPQTRQLPIVRLPDIKHAPTRSRRHTSFTNEEQPKPTHDLCGDESDQKERRYRKTDRSQSCRRLSRGKDLPRAGREKKECDQVTRNGRHVYTFAFRAPICAV